MACGLPVVGVAAGGVGESVDRAVGELADPLDRRRTSPRRSRRCSQRDLAQLGRAARQRACERHGWDAVFQQLARLYADVSGEPAFSRPGPGYALAS